MRPLIEFARRDDVRQFVTTVLAETKSDLFQGVLIGYHPLWRTFNNGGLWPSGSLPFPEPWFAFDPRFDNDWSYEGIAVDDPAASELWRKYCQYFGLPEIPPFVVIFRLRPVGIDKINEYQRIMALVRNTRKNLFVRVEQRPRAKMFAGTATNSLEGGIKIRTSAGVTGTLGGFLKDVSSGDEFALTCGHVAKVGEDVDYLDTGTNSWHALGHCVESSSLPSSPNCNVNCYLNAGAVNIDAALIELSNNVASAKIKGISGGIDELVDPQGIPHSVELVGAECGHLSLNAEKFGMWHELELPSGACTCFKDIFEVNSKTIPNIGAKLSLLFSRMVQNGDSGAWVVSANGSGGYAYCGTLIGGDTICGFAAFSKNVKDWAADSSQVNTARVLNVL